MIGTPETATAQVNAQRANNNPTPFPYTAPTATAPNGTSIGGTALTSDTQSFFDRMAGLGVFNQPTATPLAPPPIAMAAGGIVPEPVMGVGLHSGQTYTFGERGPETVVPQGQSVSDVRGKGGTGSYAGGGTIGYDPASGAAGANAFIAQFNQQQAAPQPAAAPPAASQPVAAPPPLPTQQTSALTPPAPAAPQFAGMPGPAPAQNYNAPLSPNVFNPSNLPSIVARGYNSSPLTPLFPNVGIATNGGQSLIPSAQRYNSLLPSEQQNYSGALQDEFGVVPQDIYSIMQKLMPRVSGLRTPRFAN